MPKPFQVASVPSEFLGRSASPRLPDVGGYSDGDLEKMRLMLAQTNADPAMLARIEEVRMMRRGAGAHAGLDMELLNPANGRQTMNPFEVLSDVFKR